MVLKVYGFRIGSYEYSLTGSSLNFVAVEGGSLSSGIAEGSKKYNCELKISDVSNFCAFFPSRGEKFSKTKFSDCNIRIVVHEPCCFLVIICLDALEHSSVERL